MPKKLLSAGARSTLAIEKSVLNWLKPEVVSSVIIHVEMKDNLERLVKDFVKAEFGQDIAPVFVRTDEVHGDFSCNVAMRIAGKLNKNPREIADLVVVELKKSKDVAEVNIAGPGFINIRLKDGMIFKSAMGANNLKKELDDQEIVAEYSDPNAFKVLHGGHLYTSLVGDAIANILETSGANVHRVNFGGDVGLHVAKTMWAIINELGGELSDKLSEIDDIKKLEWVSEKYVQGNDAYDEDESAKEQITDINHRIYDIHSSGDKTSDFAKIYWKCRQWSYDGFDALYKRLNMHPFEKYYPESSVFEVGRNTVKEQTGKVYKESDGAVIFEGEKYGLFTQVFINSEGLPTYAGKDVGLIFAKYADFKFDKSYMITDISQKDHIAVVLKSIEQFEPNLAKNTIHQAHGRIKLLGGQKMSSRKGNILKADDILDSAYSAYEGDKNNADDAVLGAVRYSFLKIRIGSDIVYDPKESVNLEGNSGPYLQYALVRARSILRKAESVKSLESSENLDEHERRLAFKLSEFSDAFDLALSDYSPHHICNYLYELAVVFNRFYENSRVLDGDRVELRVALVRSYEQVLSKGLSILGMPQPEQM